MAEEVGAAGEEFPTLGARVRLESGVGPAVFGQLGPAGEALPAHGA